MFLETPTTVEFLRRPPTPGALPSRPPDVTSETPSRDVATRAFSNTNHVGRIQTPRLRMRNVVKPSKRATRFFLVLSPPIFGNNCSDLTPVSVSPKTPS